jgi:hypothetical protein
MDTAEIVRLTLCAAAAVILFSFRQSIKEAIERFTDNFPRGGPGTPMHPSPAGDDALLRNRGRTDPAEPGIG